LSGWVNTLPIKKHLLAIDILIEKTTTYFKISCDDWLLLAKVAGGKL